MLRVLLVEDSARLAERLQEALAQLEGIELVAIVGDEKSAIDAVRREAVDVMILDLQLRQGTGFGVLRALGDSKPIVVVLTNYSLPEYQRRAKEMGVQHFLNKSRDYEILPDLLLALKREREH
jgi:two-component system, OmpR family, response regulator